MASIDASLLEVLAAATGSATGPTAACAAIVSNGAVAYSGAAGSVAGSAASAATTVMLTASISKTFLAALALQCAERSELDLDGDIDVHLAPLGISVRNPRFPTCPLTPRQLLQHRSSLRDDESALEHGSPYRWAASSAADASVTVSLAEYVRRRLGRDAADAAEWSAQCPGESSYHYSNCGYALLGLVVERAAGVPLPTLAHDRLFGPLGMHATSYHLGDLQRADPALQFAEPAGQPEGGHYEVAEYPAAQVRSTAHDLCQWLLFLTSPQPASNVLSRGSIGAMLPASGAGGLAWWGSDAAYYSDVTPFEHGGFMQGVRTHIYLQPPTEARPCGFGCVVLLNGLGDYSHVVTCMMKSIA